MNVGNTMNLVPSVDGQATAGLGNGKGGLVADGSAFGSLLASEMTTMLQSFQGEAELAMIPLAAEADDSNVDPGELLAMIDQLLQGGAAIMFPQQGSQEQVQPTNEAAETIEQQTAPLLSATTKEGIITAFMQQGATQEDAQKLVDLLEKLANNPPSEKQIELKPATQQLVSILSKLGIDVKVPSQQDLTFEAKGSVETNSKKTGILRDVRLTTGQPFQPTGQPVLTPIQLQAALSKYQPGTIVKPVAQPLSFDQVMQMQQSMQDAATTLGEGNQQSNLQGTNVQVTQPGSTQIAQSAMETNRPEIRAAHLPNDMANLFVKQMKIVGANGFSEAKLTLHPQSLGMVDVKITTINHVVTAHFAAESTAGKELLDNQLPQLRAALLQLGLQVDKLEVTQQQAPQQQFGFQQQREGQQSQQGQQQQKSNEEQAEFNLEALTENSSNSGWLGAKQAKVEYTV